MDFVAFRIQASYPGVDEIYDCGVLVALKYPDVGDIIHVLGDEVITGKVVFCEMFATPVQNTMIRYQVFDWSKQQTLPIYRIEVSQEASINNTMLWQIHGNGEKT